MFSIPAEFVGLLFLKVKRKFDIGRMQSDKYSSVFIILIGENFNPYQSTKKIV